MINKLVLYGLHSMQGTLRKSQHRSKVHMMMFCYDNAFRITGLCEGNSPMNSTDKSPLP